MRIVSLIACVSIEPLLDEETSKIPDVSIVEASAELLYGLVHQRFILTRAGLQAMVSPLYSSLYGSSHALLGTGRQI